VVARKRERESDRRERKKARERVIYTGIFSEIYSCVSAPAAEGS